MKSYTGKGDNGWTSIYDGRGFPKDHQLIIALGKLDTLIAAIENARIKTQYTNDLMIVQKQLSQMSAELSGYAASTTQQDILTLEQRIDALGEPPDCFVQFEKESSISLNECRVRCREAECALTPLLRANAVSNEFYTYMNRLSSYFFMLAYVTNK